MSALAGFIAGLLILLIDRMLESPEGAGFPPLNPIIIGHTPTVKGEIAMTQRPLFFLGCFFLASGAAKLLLALIQHFQSQKEGRRNG